ncbi:Ovarian serine protease, partial [Operophtera brumata]
MVCDGVRDCPSGEDERTCIGLSAPEGTPDVESCVAHDMVCDGDRDSPNGEDERTCIGLSAPEGTSYGVGQVMLRSLGVWRSKCYPTQNHTKSELEAICRELGFLSGHAKEIKEMKNTVFNTPNNLALEPFSEVILNNQTVIKMRNTNAPIARAVFDEELKNCNPVFIE